MTFEKLLEIADDENVSVKQDKIPHLNGLYINNEIILSDDLVTQAEKKVVLAEELGHHFCNYGNIIDQNDIRNRKEEYRGKKWAYKKLVTFEKIVEAFEIGITCRYCLAEYLGVTEKFLANAVEFYHNKYGIYKEYNDYLICFEPLGVIERSNYATYRKAR